MLRITFQKELDKLNEKWFLPVATADSGDCCSTCYLAEKGNPESYIAVKYYSDGPNYSGKFEDQETLYAAWGLAETRKITIADICEDLRASKIGQYYEIETPQEETVCIVFKKKENK